MRSLLQMHQLLLQENEQAAKDQSRKLYTIHDPRPYYEIADELTQQTIASEARKSAVCDPHYFVLSHGLIFSAFLAMKYLPDIHPSYQFTPGDTVLDVIRKYVTGSLYATPLTSYIQKPDGVHFHREQSVNLYLCGYDPSGGGFLYPIMYQLLILFAKSRPKSDVAKRLALPFSFDLAKIIAKINFETIAKPIGNNPEYNYLNYLGDLDYYRGLILLFPDKQDQIIEKINDAPKHSAVTEMLYYLVERGQLERFNRILYASDSKKAVTVKTEDPSSSADKQEVKEPPLKKAKISKQIPEFSSPVFASSDKEQDKGRGSDNPVILTAPLSSCNTE